MRRWADRWRFVVMVAQAGALLAIAGVLFAAERVWTWGRSR